MLPSLPNQGASLTKFELICLGSGRDLLDHGPPRKRRLTPNDGYVSHGHGLPNKHFPTYNDGMNAHIPTMFLMIIAASGTLALSVGWVARARDEDGLQLWTAALVLQTLVFGLFFFAQPNSGLFFHTFGQHGSFRQLFSFFGGHLLVSAAPLISPAVLVPTYTAGGGS